MSEHPLSVYHVSDRPDIELFEPRPSPRQDGQMLVWAVDGERLPNYLLPRDCPRVTFYASAESSPEDIERLLIGAERVVAVESAWLARILKERLYLYEFDASGFVMQDATAGYYVRSERVSPVSVRAIDDILGELLSYGVELRVMPSLWELRERVIGSTLGFSLIRMRNAQPPEKGYEAYYPLA